MKKYSFIILLFTCLQYLGAQDTVDFDIEAYHNIHRYHLAPVRGGYIQYQVIIDHLSRTITTKTDTLDIDTYRKLYLIRDSLSKIVSNAEGKYCRIYKKDTLIAEGIWTGECDLYRGEFKAYYPNGRLKDHGFYSANPELLGIKVKEWKYYYEDGNLYKEEKYSEKGELMKQKIYKDQPGGKGD